MANKNVLTLGDCSLILQELRKSIDELEIRGFPTDDRFSHFKFNTVHYRRLVVLYNKIDSVFLELQEIADNV